MYKGKQAQESEFKNWEAGPYKFKITSAVYNSDWEAIYFKMELKDGPKISDFLNINSSNDNVLAEVDRKLTTILGKPEITKAEELVGKSGYIVLRQGQKYLEPMPFGGYYTTARKSATGKESMTERVSEALAYDWTKDTYVTKAPATQSEDTPF